MACIAVKVLIIIYDTAESKCKLFLFRKCVLNTPLATVLITPNGMVVTLAASEVVTPCECQMPWWRHQVETFSALPALSEGNQPITGEFPSQRPVTRSFDSLFDLRLNKRLSQQWRRRWFETPSHSLWLHCDGVIACPFSKYRSRCAIVKTLIMVYWNS